ncbi:hypothetical protein F5B22DRAFT_606775 [Xylaria bambusicola]|uniref:uncharacterized protein n=1 Tax=Xylaria bambusicola TaxID=326684 RepID=UPI00200796EE|nr:uncharacterized protein F5B22DRAFT_606775 [Xylaria bambusicola]KAI0516848.1 hypothetical protein F5B22DRAFT_606775 [Xylaria bambusicola]
MSSFSHEQVEEAVQFVESDFSNRQVHSTTGENTNLDLQPPPGLSPEEYEQSLVQGPPPGLVRVSTPTPTPIRLLTNEDVFLFGDFARYLGEEGNIDDEGFCVKLDLKCGICFDHRLWVSNATSPDDHFNSTELFEGLGVLPCGHVFGASCLTKWLMASAQEGFTNEEGVVSCPVCRYSLVYECGHYLPPIEYNPNIDRRNTVPPTIPEGGFVPFYCEECAEGMVNEHIDKMRRFLFGPCNPGDLRFHNSAEIMRQTSREFREFTRRKWREMRIQHNMW